jgi:hypothetical protein
MKHPARLIPLVVLLIIALVLFVALSSSLPQIQVPCHLPHEDCQLLAEADANLVKELSADYTFQLSFDISQTGADVIHTTMTGTGQFSQPPNYDQLAVNPITLVGSMAGTMDIQIERGQNGTTARSSARAVLVDGKLYLKIDPQDWVVHKVDDVVLATQPAIDNRMLRQDLSTLVTHPDLIKIEKTRNTPQVEGQDQVEFVYSIDLITLLATKEFRNIFRQFTKSQTTLVALNDDQLAAYIQLVGQNFQNVELRITRWVGKNDKLTYAYFIFFSTMIEGKAWMGFVEGLEPGSASVTLALEYQLRKVGAPVKIQAPY